MTSQNNREAQSNTHLYTSKDVFKAFHYLTKIRDVSSCYSLQYFSLKKKKEKSSYKNKMLFDALPSLQ